MTEIVTLAEFASAIRKDISVAIEHMLLLELANGLVADEIGEQDPWPTVAKTTVLAAAKRAYINYDDARSQMVGATQTSYNVPLYETFVYLTENEVERLHKWLADNIGTGKPAFEFPGTWPFPDRVEREPDAVTG
jgi:hypothetical protein